MRLVGRARPRRAAVVRDRLRPRRARRRDRRRRRRLDRRAPARRGAGRVRAGRGRDRARSTTRATSLADPQLAALGSIATVDDRARADQDAERDQPPLRDARRDPTRRPRPRRRHRRRARPSSGSTRTSSRGSAREGVGVSVPPLTWLYVPADRPDRVEKAIASARARGDRRPRGRRRAARRRTRRARTSPALLDRAAREAGLRPHQPPRTSSPRPTWTSSAGSRSSRRPRAEGRRPRDVARSSRCPRDEPYRSTA